jgi:hypothetical protein
MPIESDEQAAEALFEAIQADNNLSTTDQANIAAREQVAAAKEGSEGTTDVTDSFTGLDPNTLPAEAQPFYKSLQSDYTKKMQEIAQERKQYESLQEFGGVDAAVEAVQFAQALATDPQFALTVHEQLTTALTEAGLTPAQASAVATEQISQATSEDEFSEGVDPELERRLNEQNATIEELRAWKDQQEEREYQMALANEIAAQESMITRSNPNYTEEDMSHIYRLAYATGGNLVEADKAYKELQQDVLSRYMHQKATVPAGVAPVPSAGAAEEPTTFKDLNDPNLEKLVQQYVAMQTALGE